MLRLNFVFGIRRNSFDKLFHILTPLLEIQFNSVYSHFYKIFTLYIVR